MRPEQIKQLRKEFEKVDVDANGEITIDALSQVQPQSKVEAEEEREVQAGEDQWDTHESRGDGGES